MNIAELAGSTYGGRQPIANARLYMFAADTSSTTYGHASDSLLLSYTSGSYPTAKDSNGDYYITTSSTGGFLLAAGEYSCTVGQQVYLYTVGGNPGAGTNSATGELAVLGQCGTGGSFAGVTAIKMNEVSTIAAAYAMSAFAVDALHVASTSTAASKAGLAIAFANAANLYNISTGSTLATTAHGNGTVPQALLNSLGNSLAGCVNSTGSTSSACTTLLGDALSAGSSGTAPTDTATAAINIAHYPAHAVSAIFNVAPTTAVPYSPDLSSVPNDFTVGITYSGGGMSTPSDVAIDSAGNAWVTSNTAGIVSKLSPLGVPASSSGFSVPGANFVALDSSNDAWVTSNSGDDVYELTSAGVEVSGSPFLASGSTRLSNPQGIAIADSYVVIANSGPGNVYVLNSSGVNQSFSPVSESCFNGVGLTAFDDSGNGYFAAPNDNDGCGISGINGGENFNDTGLSKPEGLAIDGSSNAWFTNNASGSLVKLSNSGANASGSPFSGGGLSSPDGVAIDGLGNAWVANSGNNSVSLFTSTGTAISGTKGYTGGTQSGTQRLAIDSAGNVWVTNHGASTVTELIGVAAPVVTPLSAAVAGQMVGARP